MRTANSRARGNNMGTSITSSQVVRTAKVTHATTVETPQHPIIMRRHRLTPNNIQIHQAQLTAHEDEAFLEHLDSNYVKISELSSDSNDSSPSDTVTKPTFSVDSKV